MRARRGRAGGEPPARSQDFRHRLVEHERCRLPRHDRGGFHAHCYPLLVFPVLRVIGWNRPYNLGAVLTASPLDSVVNYVRHAYPPRPTIAATIVVPCGRTAGPSGPTAP